MSVKKWKRMSCKVVAAKKEEEEEEEEVTLNEHSTRS